MLREYFIHSIILTINLILSRCMNQDRGVMRSTLLQIYQVSPSILAMEVQRLIMNPAIKVSRSLIHVAIQFVRIK